MKTEKVYTEKDMDAAYDKGFVDAINLKNTGEDRFKPEYVAEYRQWVKDNLTMKNPFMYVFKGNGSTYMANYIPDLFVKETKTVANVDEVSTCVNPHCENGIVDRDYYGHPIYCAICEE